MYDLDKLCICDDLTLFFMMAGTFTTNKWILDLTGLRNAYVFTFVSLFNAIRLVVHLFCIIIIGRE